jgi:hypothetical protein
VKKHNKKEEVKTQDSLCKTNLFFDIRPFNPWAMLATWLHLEAPQNL